MVTNYFNLSLLVDEEPVMTQSVSNQSAILKCSKMNHRKNIYGETKLLKAAINGNVNLLRALIQAGANVNLPDYAGDEYLFFSANIFTANMLKIIKTSILIFIKPFNSVHL